VTSATNNFNVAQSDGTTITAANSGGGTGNTAFSSVSGPAGGQTMAYDSTHAHSGTQSGKFDLAGVTTAEYVQYSPGTQTDNWVRVYLYRTANNATSNFIIRAVTTSTLVAQVRINNNGKVVVTDKANANLTTSTNAITLNAWNRFEFHVIANGAGASTMRCEMYLGANCDGTTADEVISSTTSDCGANFNGWRFGQALTGDPGAFWLDDVGYSTTGALGPAVVSWPATATGTVAVTASAVAHVRHPATATATVAVTASAVAHVRRRALATASVTIGAGATAHVIRKAAATTTVTIGASAVAHVRRIMSATGSVVIGAALTAHVWRAATATGVLAPTASATAMAGHTGAATAYVVVTASATAHRIATVSATAGVIVSAMASAHVLRVGVLDPGSVSVVASATAHVMRPMVGAGALVIGAHATAVLARAASAIGALTIAAHAVARVSTSLTAVGVVVILAGAIAHMHTWPPTGGTTTRPTTGVTHPTTGTTTRP
jgi:hypothetical protein